MLAHFAPRLACGGAAPAVQAARARRALVARAHRRCRQGAGGGRQLSRPRCTRSSSAPASRTRDNRGLHILWRWRTTALICFGAREGKQHTFALLDEWVPGDAPRPRRGAGGARAPLLHQPRSGDVEGLQLVVGSVGGDARRGARWRLAAAERHASTARSIGTRERHAALLRLAPARSGVLLPPYDEYTVAYRDRSAALDPKHAAAARNGIFSPTFVIDGRIAGTWTRRLAKRRGHDRAETVCTSDGRSCPQRGRRRRPLWPLPRSTRARRLGVRLPHQCRGPARAASARLRSLRVPPLHSKVLSITGSTGSKARRYPASSLNPAISSSKASERHRGA